MSDQLINKFKSLLTETHIRDGGKIDKFAARYTDRGIGNERCGRCEHFLSPNHCEIVEGVISPGGWCKFWEERDIDFDENMYAAGMGQGGAITEKWGTPTKVSPEERGKYAGKTKAELLKSYRALKASGPHPRNSPEYGRMRELAFAIRAKSGWGKVK